MNQITLDQLAQSGKQEGNNPFKCLHSGCQHRKPFKNAQALRMHKARVHTKTLGVGYKWKSNLTETQRLARRRVYQRKLRERYKLQGKDSRGYPKKNKPMQWTEERRARFNSTWKAKMKQRRKAKAERIQIVWPDPREQQHEAVKGPTLKYCPHCGSNLEKYL